MDKRESIDFIVGAEKRLADVVSEGEVLPLLQGAVQFGIRSAQVLDDRGTALWSFGSHMEDSLWSELQGQGECSPIFLEGEPVGYLRLSSDGIKPEVFKATTSIITGALNALLVGNLKRMLTTEIHTQVVNQSYSELLDANQQLTLSEQKYRDLAENLEVRVQQRTDELKKLYTQMVSQEKMASIGQMAAGIAHEINNPLGFVLSNLSTLQKYLARYQEMLGFYRELPAAQSSNEDFQAAADQMYKRLKLDFVSEDIQELFEESINGGQRVKKIVSDLKGFSHIDAIEEEQVDINEEIERTLSVMSHKIPAGTTIIRNFGDLPRFSCLGGMLAQVLYNLLRNAIQSRPDALEITVATSWTGTEFVVSVADNGSGIAPEIRARIFEPFYTTREVGAGIGLGLAVVYDVVNGWGGRVAVDDSSAGGARFTLNIPVENNLNG